MAQRRSGRPQPSDPLYESAGCCGLIARVLGAGLLVAAIVTLGVLLATSPPERWQGIEDATEHPLALLTSPRHTETVYAGTEQGHVLISRDGGQRWQAASKGLPQATPISAFALLPGGTQLLAGTSKGAYLSSDGGDTWHTAGPGIPSEAVVDAVAALPDGTLLAGTTGHGAYVLSAGGATWMAASRGLPAQSDIYAFLPLAQSGHVLAGLISGGIYISQDGGMTWSESDRGLNGMPTTPPLNVFSFLALSGAGLDGAADADAAILAGTSRGLYASHDHGVSWRPSSTGIGTTRVLTLAGDTVPPSRGAVVAVAGTDTGVYQSRDAGATWHALGFGLPAGQHVGAVAVLHPPGEEQVILASVDRLYRYPGQWPLAAAPWRMLGFGTLIVLAFALVAGGAWWVRDMLSEA